MYLRGRGSRDARAGDAGHDWLAAAALAVAGRLAHEWSQAERRAVLARELAHVCRGDFRASLAAQLSLALHFYHPLAHWLVARLRLEQELAADAWGATLSGGKTTYLATLAQMALRRDSRGLTWPARAFLPARGTFVRRIEMLRSTTRIPHASLPTAMRLLTVGVLATLGLLVAGLRGPAGWPAAQAQVAGQGPSHQSGAGNLLSAGDADYTIWPSCRRIRRWSSPFGPRLLLQHREIRTLLESIQSNLRCSRACWIVPPRKSTRSSSPGKEMLSFSRGRENH